MGSDCFFSKLLQDIKAKIVENNISFFIINLFKVIAFNKLVKYLIFFN